MTLTLQRLPIPDPVTADQLYFVMQRANGHWSIAAKIIAIFATEQAAEMFAAAQKKQHPHQSYGVAVLRSEAREVSNPVEIVRMSE